MLTQRGGTIWSKNGHYIEAVQLFMGESYSMGYHFMGEITFLIRAGRTFMGEPAWKAFRACAGNACALGLFEVGDFGHFVGFGYFLCQGRFSMGATQAWGSAELPFLRPVPFPVSRSHHLRLSHSVKRQ